uniref:Uncharacterized protein n=1 Tax=Anguilla anguilla TaxID=7936 RepID=A0A0E9WBL4_ANGAN
MEYRPKSHNAPNEKRTQLTVSPGPQLKVMLSAKPATWQKHFQTSQ